MPRRSDRPTIGILPALLCLGVAVTPAAAIPSFARREGVSCAACHSVPPALTAAGRSYLRNGYRWSADGDLPKDWVRQFPGALQVNFTAAATEADATANLATVQYYAAGRLHREIAGWIDGTLPNLGQATVGERNRFFLVLGNPPRRPWRLRVGDFDPPIDNKPSSSLGLSAPAIYFAGTAGNGYALGQVQRGVEAAYIGSAWSLGVFGGKGRRIGFIGNADGNELGDWAGWVEYRPPAQPWSLTGYVYLGRLSTFVPTRIYRERMGQALVAGRYWSNRWEALGGIGYGHHRNRDGDGQGKTNRGLYLEGRWFPRPLSAVYGRLDWVDPDTAAGKEAVLTVGYTRQWQGLPLRAGAEWVQTTSGDRRIDALLQAFF
jgi:hypothetical protein